MGISIKDVTFSGIFNSTVYFGDHENIKDSGLTSYSRIAAFVIDIFKRLGLSQGTVKVEIENSTIKLPTVTLILSKKEFNGWKNKFFESHVFKDGKWITTIKIVKKGLQPVKVDFNHREYATSWVASKAIEVIVGAKNHALNNN